MKKEEPRSYRKLNESNCQHLYWSVIQLLETNEEHHGAMFVRELEETRGCDCFSDLSQTRNAYSNLLSNNERARVFRYQETRDDLESIEEVISLYGPWHLNQLVSSLNYTNWLYYHTIHRFSSLFKHNKSQK